MLTNHKIKFGGMGNIRNLRIDEKRGIKTDLIILIINLNNETGNATLISAANANPILLKVLTDGLDGVKVVTAYENSLRDHPEKCFREIHEGGRIENCAVTFVKGLKTIYLSFITEFNTDQMLALEKDCDKFGEYFGVNVNTKNRHSCEFVKIAHNLVPSYFFKRNN